MPVEIYGGADDRAARSSRGEDPAGRPARPHGTCSRSRPARPGTRTAADSRHDLLIGSPEGTLVRLGDGDGVPGVPAAAGRLRAEDAAGRPGRLPQGPRRDPDRGGRLPGRSRPGGRDRVRARSRWRSAGPPGPRAGSSPTTCGREFQAASARATSRSSSGRCRTGSSSARATSASRRERRDRSTAPILDLPEPWGPLEPLATVLPAGAIVCAYLPDDDPGPAARARVGRQRVRAPRDVRGAPARRGT